MTAPAAIGAAPLAAERPPALELDGLAVRAGGRWLVSEVSATLAQGSWTTIVGPNGAGKSTLLRAVGGLIGYDGAVRLGGEPVHRLSPRDRARRVAFVPQTPVLPPAMTVASYVLLGRTAHVGRLARESRRDLDVVTAVLHRLGLAELVARPLATLSGGEAQRVAIGRALAQEAPLLLLDEPTSSLDIGHQLDVLDLVEELRADGELTVLSTMHDLTLAGQYADRLMLLHGGRVVAAGAPADVLTEHNLARLYQAHARVVRDGDTVIVVPVRRTNGRGAP